MSPFTSLRLITLTVAAALVLGACGGRARTRTDAGPMRDGGPAPVSCSRGGPPVVCQGVLELQCGSDGSVQGMRNCGTEGLVCAPGLGCRTCQPGRGSCDGNTTQLCNADGTGYTPGMMCDGAAGESCNPTTGTCASLCRDAEASNSYIGCEYWPTPVLNSNVAPEFEFAVVVANPQTVQADITITRGGSMVRTVTVNAGGLETIKLPWVNELKGTAGSEASALVPGGAYRLRSTVPVTVYQFNALDYRIPRDCASEPDLLPDGQCFSYTNDASLLLPTHVLTGNYMVLSRPAMLNELPGLFGPELAGSPGYFAVIGVDEAPVTVGINFTAHVAAGGGVSSYAPGGMDTFTLDQGDVLQIVSGMPTRCTPGGSDTPSPGTTVTYCTVGADYDLTGTEIRASGRVAVISGHNCDFVPFNRWACDHLEEAMFPLEAWGSDYVISATEPLRGEPNLLRIVSSHDGNMITFDPASVSAPRMLNRGQMVELETRGDVRLTAPDAFMVAQFLVGQDYEGYGASGMMGNGDPAFSLGIPTEQFRTSYTFLAPESYAISYVNVTAPSGQPVTLDGSPVAGWRDVGGTGMATARVMIPGGQHRIEAAVAFGIVVYGFGSYTSYMVPGGLDFEAINIPF